MYVGTVSLAAKVLRSRTYQEETGDHSYAHFQDSGAFWTIGGAIMNPETHSDQKSRGTLRKVVSDFDCRDITTLLDVPLGRLWSNGFGNDCWSKGYFLNPTD